MARSKGEGTLVKRGRYWAARWVHDGQVHVRSTKCTSKRDAEKKLAEFTKPYREKNDIAVLENLAAKIRVKETGVDDKAYGKPVMIKFLVDTLKSDVSSSPLTAGSEAGYEARVTQFEKFVGKTYVHEVTASDVEKFLQSKKKEVGIGTYNQYISTMRKLFSVAMKHDKRIKTNVWDAFTKLKIDKSAKRRELTSDEVKKLCDEAEKCKLYNGELGTLFLVGVYTGLRVSDCVALKWCDVDMQRKLITVLPIKTSKNGRKACIPIHPKLLERLNTLDMNTTHVMPTLAQSSMRKIMHAINGIFKSAGIDVSVKGKDGKKHVETGFHAFRHYFISNCVKNGIPVSVVQKMVAHSSADMSLAYTHTFDSDLRLPDYDGETERIALKKTTIAALDKARGVHDRDDFIMHLLSESRAPLAVKTIQDKALDEALDEMFT